MPGLKRKHHEDTVGSSEESPPQTKRSKPAKGEESTAEDVELNPDAESGKLSRFRISKGTRKTLRSRGVRHLFPIQYLTFDDVYEGKDVIGQARKSDQVIVMCLPCECVCVCPWLL